jgi:hypothetical protein
MSHPRHRPNRGPTLGGWISPLEKHDGDADSSRPHGVDGHLLEDVSMRGVRKLFVGFIAGTGLIIMGCGESVGPFGLTLDPAEVTLARGTENQAGDVTETFADFDILIDCLDNRGDFFVELSAAGVPANVTIDFIPSGIPGVAGGLVNCASGGASDPAPTTVEVGLATPGEYQITITASTFENQDAIISADPLMTETAILTLTVTPTP